MSKNKWHYRVFRRPGYLCKWLYTIREYYAPCSYTEDSIPFGETRGELIKDLENMLADAKRYSTKTLKDRGDE